MSGNGFGGYNPYEKKLEEERIAQLASVSGGVQQPQHQQDQQQQQQNLQRDPQQQQAQFLQQQRNQQQDQQQLLQNQQNQQHMVPSGQQAAPDVPVDGPVRSYGPDGQLIVTFNGYVLTPAQIEMLEEAERDADRRAALKAERIMRGLALEQLRQENERLQQASLSLTPDQLEDVKTARMAGVHLTPAQLLELESAKMANKRKAEALAERVAQEQQQQKQQKQHEQQHQELRRRFFDDTELMRNRLERTAEKPSIGAGRSRGGGNRGRGRGSVDYGRGRGRGRGDGGRGRGGGRGDGNSGRGGGEGQREVAAALPPVPERAVDN
ncbi:hypothetical protein PG999_001508 [Apiospora kogelbergensis]|uniref:Uncharacterized protein n=1 Tax=Apiospora kogelbergensis TaxID=1337665 RepID=A0AAW0R5Q9_9PEZI